MIVPQDCSLTVYGWLSSPRATRQPTSFLAWWRNVNRVGLLALSLETVSKPRRFRCFPALALDGHAGQRLAIGAHHMDFALLVALEHGLGAQRCRILRGVDEDDRAVRGLRGERHPFASYSDNKVGVATKALLCFLGSFFPSVVKNSRGSTHAGRYRFSAARTNTPPGPGKTPKR